MQKKYEYAPIAVFAFNRPDELKHMIESLKANPESKDSDLFVFVDGPRPSNEKDAFLVSEVLKFVNTITGFKSVTIEASPKNKGLAPSIISGVSKVIDKYGKVIVLEDDLILSKAFLKFMNKALDVFEYDERVFQVSGYSPKISFPKGYGYDAYMNGRAQSWSWGTWKNRWNLIDWEVRDFQQLKADKKARREFNRHGSDMYNMLKGFMYGRNNSWYIRFCYAMHKLGKYSVCPRYSLVQNDGFGGNATHCRNYNRYKIEFQEYKSGDFSIDRQMTPDKRIVKKAIKFWTIRYRVYGKIMTIITRLLG